MRPWCLCRLLRDLHRVQIRKAKRSLGRLCVMRMQVGKVQSQRYPVMSSEDQQENVVGKPRPHRCNARVEDLLQVG